MRTSVFAAAAASVVGASLTTAIASAPSSTGVGGEIVVVARIVDGDTILLRDGRRVRLVQIDAPEIGGGECFSRASAKALRRLLPQGGAVRLEADPRLDAVDRYGRLLRYVWRGSVNANLELVREGAAAPWFYGGVSGRYAEALMNAAVSARSRRAGLWGSCPGTVLDPTRGVATRQARSGQPVAGSAQPPGRCDPSYVGVCIPSPPPDLDCTDIAARRFTVRWDVPNPDPHHLDSDRDGVGCES